MMMHSTNFAYVASRGSGKSWLTSLYCVVRCILYPGTKICVASGVKSQATEIITKIDTEFLKNYSWGSSNLKNEISFISTSVNNARVDFKNGSWINVVTSNDNARHNRANIIVVDEFRMVDKSTIETVLQKFLTAPRRPGYLNNPQYSNMEERNCEIYMTSAYYQSHWSYKKVQAFFKNMLDDKRRYFCCGLPYQLAIKEGLLQREQVEDQMSEDDFDEMSWAMEMSTLWYGASDNAFFKFDDLAKRRKIKTPFFPLNIYKNHKMKVPELKLGERRILSVDVALLASTKRNNDAAALIINSAIANDRNEYINNIVYIEAHEGLTTDELGIIVMRTFYQYNCTDLVLDTAGQGIGVYDYIIKNQYDVEHGIQYDGMSCINDDEMAARCKIKNAKKVIWSIKANPKFNNNAAINLRALFINNKINLLIHEFEFEENMLTNKQLQNLTDEEKLQVKSLFVQTSLLINETINLDHEIKGTNIKMIEKSGMRKDRFSSLEYNVYIAQELAIKSKPKDDDILDIIDLMPITKAKRLSYY